MQRDALKLTRSQITAHVLLFHSRFDWKL